MIQKSNTLARLALSPFIFLYGVLLSCAGMLFPLTILSAISFYHLLASPVIKLFRLARIEVDYPDSFTKASKIPAVNYFVDFTVPIWLPFYLSFDFVKTGKLLKLD